MSSKIDNMKEKIEYLGLDLENIPSTIKNFKPIKYRIPKFYDEKQYKQYRYVSIKNIQILLSPTNRLDDIQDKYKQASPLIDYLDNKNEDNFIKHTTFLNMLRKVKIEDIEKIEKEQENLNKKVPFKVKFEGNYLWQIYYSETTDQYFMLVPTEDSDYSTFFYLLKKQLEKGRTGKVFVPVRNIEYSSTFLKKSQYEDLENYIWLFTKDWPLIYDVYDKTNKLSINIVGETEVYDKIKSPYKVKLGSLLQASQFYKLLKAMFILQTELPHYFEFKTNINRQGEIEFFVEDRKIEYSDIATWINGEYHLGEDKLDDVNKLIEEDKEKLENLKIEISTQEIEYLAKEKQISTFLECKKTFLGKFKYYFKYSAKGQKNKIKNKKEETIKIEEQPDEEMPTRKRRRRKKENYNIEEIVDLYKELETQENTLKNLVMDINSLKLKNKNMKKKIENATAFIDEIDSHKKSIFEFWKYSNKDEVATLPEGESEEINIVKKITKVFDYEEDLEKLGKTMDKMQRKALSKEETNGIYLTTTDVIDILNKVKCNKFEIKDIESSLKEMKKQAAEQKSLSETDEFDIFGGISQDSTKVLKIKNKKHRELPKDKFNILEINKKTNHLTYKLTLENMVEDIQKAIEKVVVPQELPVYKAIPAEELDDSKINVFNINPENEMKEVLKTDKNKINFYKINLKEGTNAVSYTNIIFYDNQNKTLPIGQDLSTKILIDVSKLELELKEKSTFKILEFENEKDDFSNINIKTISLFEYDLKENEESKDKNKEVKTKLKKFNNIRSL